MRPLAFCLTLALLSPALSTGQADALRERRLARSATAAAAQSPLRFQDALRAAGIPVGLHVRAERWADLGPDAWRTAPADGPNASDGPTLREATDLFVSHHPGWTTEITTRGVVLRGPGLTSRDDHVDDFSLTDLDVPAAFAAAERAIDPTLPVRGGVVASIIGTPGEPSPTVPAGRVTVHLTHATLEDILNAIAAESPGTGWVLVRHEDADGTYDTLSVRYIEGLQSNSSNPLPVRRP
ncbi:MAG: hypothetical protein AB7O67_21680 [Vicinamibacterales bacterium]